MKNHFLVNFLLLCSLVFAEAEKEQPSEKDIGDSDKSVIVNKDGLNDDTTTEGILEKNKIYPPKGQERQTLKDVAEEAKKNGLSAVSLLALYSNGNALKYLPESVFQTAEKQLEDATRTDQQLVDYGDDIEGAANENTEEPKENEPEPKNEEQKEKEPAPKEEEEPQETKEGANTGSSTLRLK